jgi:pilus assembly protein Flp/PilA
VITTFACVAFESPSDSRAVKSFAIGSAHVQRRLRRGANDGWTGAVSEYWSFKMKKFLNDEAGATAIEYGLIAAAMGLALVTAMPSITAAIKTKFASIGGHVSSGT